MLSMFTMGNLQLDGIKTSVTFTITAWKKFQPECQHVNTVKISRLFVLSDYIVPYIQSHPLTGSATDISCVRTYFIHYSASYVASHTQQWAYCVTLLASLS